MDFFLMDKCEKGDTIILVGFTKVINSKMAKTFKEHKVVGLASDVCDHISSFEHVLKKYAKGKAFTNEQAMYCKFMMEAIHNNFEHKESYLMNIVFNTTYVQKFAEHFKDGWNDINVFGVAIKKHIDTFKAQPQDVFELSGLYFVNSPIEFYTDFVFKYGKRYDNLNLIDVATMKVYFKKMFGSTKDVRKFCEAHCDKVLGVGGFYSGTLTKRFMAATKNMTNVSEIV